ncbi:MAG: lysophospholipid acyltransferase family protein [Acidobacteriota bacterium]
MTPSPIKRLTLADLILNRSGTLVFRMILAIFGIALRLFFRRIETVNADIVPRGTGVIFVLNHPNGLIDPALVFVSLPRRISFLAKSTLFRMPVISFLLRTVDALPLYRKIDAGEDVSKNSKTFKVCSELLQRGGSIALFPEGVSHNSPNLLPIKTGAARIALGAVSVGSGVSKLDLKITPVGLFYTSKGTFRSEALLHFGEPFTVEQIVLDAEGQPPRDAVRQLTDRIDAALREVTLNAGSDFELQTARKAEAILAAAAVNENLGEKLEFLQRFVSGNGAVDTGLRAKVSEFDDRLDAFGIEPEHLSLAQFSRASVLRQALLQIWPLILLLPLAFIGTLLHYPAYRLCGVIARHMSKHGADDVESTVKVLAGIVIVPTTWAVAATVSAFFLGWIAAPIAVIASAICGYAALYTQEEVLELSGWANAIRLFLTRREAFLRLFIERRALQEELRAYD